MFYDFEVDFVRLRSLRYYGHAAGCHMKRLKDDDNDDGDYDEVR